jgi:hypothetical protein
VIWQHSRSRSPVGTRPVTPQLQMPSEKSEEARERRLAEIRDQVARGELTVRQLSPQELAAEGERAGRRFPPRGVHHSAAPGLTVMRLTALLASARATPTRRRTSSTVTGPNWTRRPA